RRGAGAVLPHDLLAERHRFIVAPKIRQLRRSIQERARGYHFRPRAEPGRTLGPELLTGSISRPGSGVFSNLGSGDPFRALRWLPGQQLAGLERGQLRSLPGQSLGRRDGDRPRRQWSRCLAIGEGSTIAGLGERRIDGAEVETI